MNLKVTQEGEEQHQQQLQPMYWQDVSALKEYIQKHKEKD